MIERLAWNIFKTTGNVNTYLEFKQIENIQKNQEEMQKVETDEYNKNKGNNNM